MEPSAIKNVIFDFGNVLLDIDLPRIKSGFAALLGSDAQRVLSDLNARDVFHTYEKGGISSEEFLDQIFRTSGGKVSPDEAKQIWNSIFIGMPAHRFEMLLKLRQQYQVFLLSNINDLHLSWITTYLQDQYAIHDFERRYFDGVYYSHFVRLRKPDREIYEFMLADAELKAEESVFFDDLVPNIEMARACGITGIVHDPKNDIAAEVRNLGLLS